MKIFLPSLHLATTTVTLAFLISPPSLSAAQTSAVVDAATPSADERSNDLAWQKASATYDARRHELLREVDKGDQDGPFRPDWNSLAKYNPPDWYKDAKFGIFIHWGVYSVPAFGSEWYPRNMYRQGEPEYKHHLATYGPLTKFGYKDFIPLFKAEHFDPVAWAKLFKDAGAKYVVPVYEHHDGFTMYDSSLSDWSVVKMGPHRDIVGDLADAVRAQGLYLGASTHRIEHDWFMDAGRKLESDVRDERYAAFYGPAQPVRRDHTDTHLGLKAYVSQAFISDWLARDADFVTKYHPDAIFFDWWIVNPEVEPYLKRFAAFYYNESLKRGTLGVIFNKYEAMKQHSGVLDIERGQLSAIRADYWQTDTSVSNKSWGYIDGDTFKTPESIVQQLVDIVSKNGNLLLNIGPRSDGTIPDEVQQVLRDIGGWLQVNGEAIYSTRPWKTFGEGPTKVVEGAFHDTDTHSYTSQDFRFTSKGNVLYAIELGWPASGEAVIRSLKLNNELGAGVDSVKLLGSDASLKFKQQSDGLHIQVHGGAPGKYAYSFRIALSASKP